MTERKPTTIEKTPEGGVYVVFHDEEEFVRFLRLVKGEEEEKEEPNERQQQIHH